MMSMLGFRVVMVAWVKKNFDRYNVGNIMVDDVRISSSDENRIQ